MKIYNSWLTAFSECWGPFLRRFLRVWRCVGEPGGEGVGGRER